MVLRAVSPTRETARSAEADIDWLNRFKTARSAEADIKTGLTDLRLCQIYIT